MTAETAASNGRNIEPVYLVWNGEMTFDAPLRLVWRHVIDYPSWQNYARIERMSGNAGQEGELVMLVKEEKGFQFPPYFARTIKLEPPRRVIWKTYPERGQEVDFFGIVEYKLDQVAGKTRLRYDTLYEFLVPYEDERELEGYKKQQYENFGALFALILPKLREAVEEDMSRGGR